MKITRQLLTFAFATAGFTSNSYARDWPDAGGWTIGETDTGCFMNQEYEGAGDTALALTLNSDDSQNLIVTNSNWSTKKENIYSLVFIVNGSQYSGGKSIGIDLLGKPGFGTAMSGDFAADFAKGSNLRIFNGETLVDSLSLTGTGAGVAMLRRCTASVKARVDAENREKARLAYIPKDPFASSAPLINGPPAAPRGNRASWVTTDDYPPSSIRNQEQGTVTIDYLVNDQGRIEDCKILTSSGSPTLDDTTCRLVTRRGRYSPEGFAGKRQTSTHVWRLPDE